MKLELKAAAGLVKQKNTGLVYQKNTPNTTRAPNYLGVHTYYRTETTKFRLMKHN